LVSSAPQADWKVLEGIKALAEPMFQFRRWFSITLRSHWVKEFDSFSYLKRIIPPIQRGFVHLNPRDFFLKPVEMRGFPSLFLDEATAYTEMGDEHKVFGKYRNQN